MSLQSQSRESIIIWMKQFHHMADSLNTQALRMFYTKNSTLQYCNLEPFVGFESIEKFFSTTLPSLESMKHEIIQIDSIGNKIYLTCTITYEVKGDPEKKKIKVPAMGVFDIKEDWEGNMGNEPILERLQVYLDGSEVWARIGMVKEGKL